MSTSAQSKSRRRAAWGREIRKYEAGDRRSTPPRRPIVFTGSSSIRFWKTLARDMAPLPVLNRGFGGGRMYEVVAYAPRMVIPYDPRAVVVYAGENDIAGILFSRRQTAEEVRADFSELCTVLHDADADLPIFYISIKPPKRRGKYWPEMQRANSLIAQDCAADPRLHYIDIGPALLDEQGQLREQLFRWDGIHLNAEGYERWTAVIRPILLEAFPAEQG